MQLPKYGVPRKSLTLGTDPEMFVFKGNRLLPAFEFLPDKHAPLKKPYTSLYWDGFQAEFKLHNPGFCLMQFTQSVQHGLYQLYAAAKEHADTAKLSLRSVIRLSPETLAKAKEPHVRLGCDPSFNAYDLKGALVGDARTLPYRFAGGHLHFGFSTEPDHVGITKKLDAILGIWSVGAAKSFDNPVRRQYYGLPGEYRRPHYDKDVNWCYGLEYRVLSNFWFAHPVIFQITCEIGRMAVSFATSEYAEAWKAEDEEVVEAIATSNTQLAAKILTRNRAVFSAILCGYFGRSEIKRAFYLGLNGIESEIKNPEAIETNWKLAGYPKNEIDDFAETHPDYTWRGHCAG